LEPNTGTLGDPPWLEKKKKKKKKKQPRKMNSKSLTTPK
jgi:hypothetical protein